MQAYHSTYAGFWKFCKINPVQPRQRCLTVSICALKVGGPVSQGRPCVPMPTLCPNVGPVSQCWPCVPMSALCPNDGPQNSRPELVPYDLTQFLQANARIFIQIRPRLLPSTSILMYSRIPLSIFDIWTYHMNVPLNATRMKNQTLQISVWRSYKLMDAHQHYIHPVSFERDSLTPNSLKAIGLFQVLNTRINISFT